MSELKSDKKTLLEVFDRMWVMPYDWDGKVNLHGPMVRKVFDLSKEQNMTRKKWSALLNDCFRVVCEAHDLKPYRRSWFTSFKNYESSVGWTVDRARKAIDKCTLWLRKNAQ